MITLTESAATKIRELLTSRLDPGIRVGVQGGGCSGFRYRLEFGAPDDADRVFEDKGVELYIDKKSLLYLMGTEINYFDTLAGSGFKFENASARRTCGCGESFGI